MTAVPEGDPETIGAHAARTRGQGAAFAAASGPMPAGSPAVIATRGFIPDPLLAAASVAAGAAAARPAAAAGSAAGRVIAAALAPAAAVLHAFGIGQFVAQAAFQASAQS